MPNRLNKNTKIVATIGPVTESEETLKELMQAGMNVARFNTKHGTPEWHQERIKRVRKVAKELEISVGVLLDLQGPEIRINLPGEQGFDMKKGDTAVFSHDESRSDDNLVLIPKNVVETLQVGNLILLDDGLCEFEISKKGKDYFEAKALSDFPVNHRKTMNTPGITIDMPSLIEADIVQLDGVTSKDVDFIGLSFVRDKDDIEHLRKEMKKRDLEAAIVAKIENQAALDNLDEIIEASDAVMVARGDLAVEVPFEQLSFWQKLIITKCRFAGKPVITATQMLKSMVDQPRPTRAEVSDISNAIYDQTSAVMLSEETTIGKYPVKAVETQAKIASFNEKYVESNLEDWADETYRSSVTHSAIYLLNHSSEEFQSIICITSAGKTAMLLARFRPNIPVIAVTNNLKTYMKLSLVYGVIPVFTTQPIGKVQCSAEILTDLRERKLAKKGEQVLYVHAYFGKVPTQTNSLTVMTVC